MELQKQRFRRRIAGEGDAPGEQFEEDDPHGVEVGPAVQRVAASLLGAHVLGRAAHQPRSRQRAALRRRLLFQDLRQAEIHHLDEVEPRAERLEHYVVGLQVAVHDAEGVRLFERGERLFQHVGDTRERQRPLVVHHARQMSTAQVLHHDVRLTLLGAPEIEDGDRVRMAQTAGRPGLVEEARRGELVVGQVGMHHLDGHGAPQSNLLGAVHPAHAPHSDQVRHAVAARERSTDQRVVLPTLRGAIQLGPAGEAEAVRLPARGRAVGAEKHGFRWKVGASLPQGRRLLSL